ncbi:MAG: hypothetical protein R3B49_10260 [Phycisphaerales bacterium]
MPDRFLLRVLFLLAALGFGVARGQDQGAGEVQVQVVQLGVGNSPRPGTWTGVQIQLNDLGLEPRNVILRVQSRDPDGDRPLYDRVVATNPGTPQAFWDYLRLPYTFEMSDSLTVRVYEASDTGAGEGQLGYRAGRILGSATTNVGQSMQMQTDSAIAVMDDWDYGLKEYQQQTPPPGGWPPSAHDRVWVVNGLRVSQLPDRWQGYAAFDALVWGRGTGAYDPGAMTPEQTHAIEEWVARGGHLIVVLPTTGQEWTGQASNQLRRLLPAMGTPVRHDGVDLEAYRWLLLDRASSTGRDTSGAALAKSVVVHELVPSEDAGVGEAVVVLRGPPMPGSPEGWPLVLRRSVGSGAVSVIGLDLSMASLRGAGTGAPDAETFWHRVLGRRGEFLTQAELDAKNLGNFGPARDPVYFDDDIAPGIAKSGSAVQGVLLGLVLFVVYWLIAGPLGFAVLAKRKLKHLAWPVFLAVVGVFTAISWTGAAVLRPKRVNGSHVTYFEQVYGQDVQRARSWVSVLIPRYGEDTIAVGAPDEGNLIAPWDESDAPFGSLQAFPDNRGYRLEARAPTEMSPPARQTVKQVQVDWSGPERWAMIRPVGAQPGDRGEITIESDEVRTATYLGGFLEHALPAGLEDVYIVVVEGQQRVQASPPRNALVSRVQAWKLQPASEPWMPGQRLDLAKETAPDPRDSSGAVRNPEKFLEDLLREGRERTPGARGRGDVAGRLAAVRFFSQLQPGEPLLDKGERRVARRTASQGWDLGRWFTQPCVIVVGQMVTDEASVEASPVPLTVDGRAVPMSGRTVVSWIYPLPENPPTWDVMAPAAGSGEKNEG